MVTRRTRHRLEQAAMDCFTDPKMTANRAELAGKAAPGQRRTLSRSRKLVYGLLVTAVLLLLLEGVSRVLMAQAPNLRWEYHQNLVATIGFPGLGEILEPDARYFWRVKP